MTLWDFTQHATFCGDIEIKLFDADGREKEYKRLHSRSELDCRFEDLDEWEDFEVDYIYATESLTGKPWLVIELIEPAE